MLTASHNKWTVLFQHLKAPLSYFGDDANNSSAHVYEWSVWLADKTLPGVIMNENTDLFFLLCLWLLLM